MVDDSKTMSCVLRAWEEIMLAVLVCPFYTYFQLEGIKRGDGEMYLRASVTIKTAIRNLAIYFIREDSKVDKNM